LSEVALLYTTLPGEAEARTLAEAVLAERLAACVNILAPCTSIYRWQGQVERAIEVPVLFKVPADRAEALRSRIEALHPYDLPVVESWPVATGERVAGWVDAETA
jgi:periplasmic divalent cation tolerance protein